MSGGSMDYLYLKIENDASFTLNTPERKAFKKHLALVQKALRDIEWVDSCDKGKGDETESIRACLGDGAVLSQTIDDAHDAMKNLRDELERACSGKKN